MMLCADEMIGGIDEADALSFKSPIRRLGSTRKILYFNSEYLNIFILIGTQYLIFSITISIRNEQNYIKSQQQLLLNAVE